MSEKEDYDVEFRSYEDDAWYSVRLIFRGTKLTVKYLGFPDDHANVFDAASGSWSADDLEDLAARFRPLSAQLQDSDCSKVVDGSHVCASHSFARNDLLFYDAVVEEVKYKKHSGKEECRCSFLLLWQHGPGCGKLTAKTIESMCLVQSSAHAFPEVTSFIEVAKKKSRSASQNSDAILPAPAEDSGNAGKDSPSVHESTFAYDLAQGRKCMKQSVIQPSEANQDTDIGGVDCNYILLLENLEKELSAWTIMEFIHRQTSILSHVFVFPTSSSESYARAIFLLNCKKDLEELCSFLDSPNHIITSSKGRPWIATQKLTMYKTSQSLVGSLRHLSLDKTLSGSRRTINELKVVYSGTKEYMTAKKLEDLFMEFVSYQEGLHKRLAAEERKILRQF